MGERVVVWLDNIPYYLTGVGRDVDGKLTGGWVENGFWDLHVDGNTGKAMSDGFEMHKWTFREIFEYNVPREWWSWHYNEIIEKVEGAMFQNGVTQMREHRERFCKCFENVLNKSKGCYRTTREDAKIYVAEQMKKQPNTVFDIREIV